MITEIQRDEASLSIIRYLLGAPLPDASLAHAAAKWLVAGADNPGIVALAGLSAKASDWEVRDIALNVLEELEILGEDDSNQFDTLASYLVRSIVRYPDKAEEYSKLLWRLARRHQEEVRTEDLDELIGLASSWDEPYADQLGEALEDAARRYLKGRQ
ncbi:hypothetical protein [Curtobacterium sp. VKM Ac-2922]|uniref:hypothetical protein n=1 Tax=Curtobacterium sp. VKM Ac-2922 TaxID=2929475 RepID=UPI001FB52707|nr:hypothetical protein [Curtobacterium sp. VKM Ac-2922]MCJ1715126.1 hypothetical protein [Curtobacterium sp. VKM Ac-2922]